MAEITYHNNPKLRTILPEWKGNPMANGHFFDPQKRFTGSIGKALRWQLSKKEMVNEKKADTWRLSVCKGAYFLRDKNNLLVWLGHASFYLQLNGIRIITDPVFGRISGIVRRHSDLPCAPEEFHHIDYVLLSHAHRDHCDAASLKKLSANNRFELLTSLGTGKLASKWIRGNSYQEAGWYQPYHLKEKNFQITFLPTQHWSNRFGWDINHTLWGSFMIEAAGLTIYFGGDSGYCDYPKQIAELFPKIDLAMIGVGAYRPAFMMRDVHTNPYEAVQVYHDLKAKILVPMHYGTFDLADEPPGEPSRILNQLEKDKQIKGTLCMPQVGEVVYL